MLNHCQASREACHGPLCCLLKNTMRSNWPISIRRGEKVEKVGETLSLLLHEGKNATQKQCIPSLEVGCRAFGKFFREKSGETDEPCIETVPGEAPLASRMKPNVA